MLAAVGHPVRRLQRSRYGPLTADGLQPGEWRELTPAELAALRAEPGSAEPEAASPPAPTPAAEPPVDELFHFRFHNLAPDMSARPSG